MISIHSVIDRFTSLLILSIANQGQNCALLMFHGGWIGSRLKEGARRSMTLNAQALGLVSFVRSTLLRGRMNFGTRGPMDNCLKQLFICV